MGNKFMNLPIQFLDVLQEDEMIFVFGGSVKSNPNNGNGVCTDDNAPNNGSGTCDGTNNGDGTCGGTNNGDGKCGTN